MTISHYPVFYIGGYASTCMVQYPIHGTTYQHLSHGIAYIYKWRIRFFFYQPWHCLSIYPQPIIELAQWKNFHFYIKLTKPQIISTLDSLMYAWNYAFNYIDVTTKHWYCPVLLLHWRSLKWVLWWIPIKFIW